MTTRWIYPALGALALAGLAGSAHAAWGNSDCAHVQAYRQLAASAALGDGINSSNTELFMNNPVMIRAFDEDFAARPPAPTHKAKRPDSAAAPARS